MAKQLGLPLLRSTGLPFRPRRRTIHRAAQRLLGAYLNAAPSAAAFLARSLAEDQAYLAELRIRSREAGKRLKHRSGAPLAAFAATLEGRRVLRLMDRLSERIESAQETVLCG